MVVRRLVFGFLLTGVLAAPAFAAPDLSGNWHRQSVSSVFLRLFPEYSPVIEPLCSVSAVLAPGGDLPWLSESRAVFERSAMDGEMLAVEILADEHPNAFAYPADGAEPARIVLTEGLLTRLNSDSQIAFVLAHEMAHIELNHFAPALPAMFLSEEQLEHISNVHAGWEVEADNAAHERLAFHGFALEQVAVLFETLREFESPETTTAALPAHPSIDNRIALARTFSQR